MSLLLTIAIATSLTAFQRPSQEPSGNPQLTSELVTETAQADLIRDVLVPVREPGILENMLVKEGDWVQAGQVLAELDRKLNELEFQAAEKKHQISELKASDDVDERYSTKSKEVAQATLARSQSAVDNFPNSISKTEIEQLRLELERATLSIEKSQFERKLAGAESELNAREADASEVRLAQRTIHSPIAGMVVEVTPQAGEWLNAGQAVARVIQLDRMRIKALMPSGQIDQSFIGRRAIFESELTHQRYEGTIHFVSPEILPGSEKVQFWFDVDSPDKLLRRREAGTVRIPPPELKPADKTH